MGVLAPHEGILTAAAPCALHRQNTPASEYFSSHRALWAAPSALLAATGGTRGAAEVMPCSLPPVIPSVSEESPHTLSYRYDDAG